MSVSTHRDLLNGGEPIRASQVLDTVGLYCPVPIIKTVDRVRRMRDGEVLEILSDDRVILVDMPAWCKSTGNEYLGFRQSEHELHLFIRKGNRPA